MWSSQHRLSNIIPISNLIDWNTTWLYLNNNYKRTYHYTNFQLSQSRSHKIKILLNILPTLANLHALYPTNFPTINCITCNIHEHPFHWLLCPNTSTLNNIIHQAILDNINTSLLDITTTDLQILQTRLIQNPNLSLTSTSSHQTNIYTTLQGFVPIDLISTIRPYTSSNSEATRITIKLLIKISQQIYEQIWKPYCIRFSQWKKTHNIPTYNYTRQNSIPRKPRNHSQNTLQPRQHYTYSCICGLPDQQHSDNNTCPPLGKALRKIDLWINEWILYSTPTNHILHYQI